MVTRIRTDPVLTMVSQSSRQVATSAGSTAYSARGDIWLVLAAQRLQQSLCSKRKGQHRGRPPLGPGSPAPPEPPPRGGISQPTMARSSSA
jgi:hypothetical protein